MRNYTLTEKQLESLKKMFDAMHEAPGKIETEINDEYHAEGGEGDIEIRGTLEVMFDDLSRDLKYLIEDVENQPASIQWVEDVKEFRRLYKLNTRRRQKKTFGHNSSASGKSSLSYLMKSVKAISGRPLKSLTASATCCSRRSALSSFWTATYKAHSPRWCAAT